MKPSRLQSASISSYAYDREVENVADGWVTDYGVDLKGPVSSDNVPVFCSIAICSNKKCYNVITKRKEMTMAASDSIRIRVDADFKERVARMYAQRGTTVSAAVRAFLSEELAAYSSALDVFDSIMASADRKLDASGMQEPTIDDINDYISQVRAERASQGLVAS